MKRTWPSQDMQEFYLTRIETKSSLKRYVEEEGDDFLKGKIPDYFPDPYEDDE